MQTFEDQWIGSVGRVFAAKPDNQSSNPRTHRVEGEPAPKSHPELHVQAVAPAQHPVDK